eukprot:NODE_2006_length_1326_cov_8.091621_g1822_i0.p1 GENE.NODE_2006_length_1326_cov_8.091621_g1822_i0~~NODE_2006_length_1326_cov_8.091621_g1822_i0.p1  ORF type:complete len:260 (-),score=26.96 NODE_2006_length_1326_cov_8.091621_g1822_i0:417-1196(-)
MDGQLRYPDSLAWDSAYFVNLSSTEAAHVLASSSARPETEAVVWQLVVSWGLRRTPADNPGLLPVVLRDSGLLHFVRFSLLPKQLQHAVVTSGLVPAAVMARAFGTGNLATVHNGNGSDLSRSGPQYVPPPLASMQRDEHPMTPPRVSTPSRTSSRAFDPRSPTVGVMRTPTHMVYSSSSNQLGSERSITRLIMADPRSPSSAIQRTPIGQCPPARCVDQFTFTSGSQQSNQQHVSQKVVRPKIRTAFFNLTNMSELST